MIPRKLILALVCCAVPASLGAVALATPESGAPPMPQAASESAASATKAVRSEAITDIGVFLLSARGVAALC